MRRARTRATARLLGLVAVGLVLATGCDPTYAERPIAHLLGTVGSDSTLIGCDRAGDRIVLTASAHLDPACTYTAGVTITASSVVLDCRGAHIVSPVATNDTGILITSPVDVAQAHVRVRNCFVKGFGNNLRVTRAGFRSLTTGHEYDHTSADIVVEHSNFYASSGTGIFVDAYVSDVTVRDAEVAGSGSVGIYLEAGSQGNTVQADTIYDNGFAGTGPEGLPVPGMPHYRFHSTGREGIAVDGSRHNVIRSNRIAHNAAGGIFLYKNCGEYATQQPGQWWNRPYGADGNLIEGNTISTGPTGVWVGSRMAENQYFMDCSDTPYVSTGVQRIILDHARDNIVRGNELVNLTYGVRVEDDGTRVEQNRFRAVDPAASALLVGTQFRTNRLGRPVIDTVVTGNQADIAGNASPFHTVPGAGAVTFSANLSAGLPTTLTKTAQPQINPFLFVKDVFPAP